MYIKYPLVPWYRFYSRMYSSMNRATDYLIVYQGYSSTCSRSTIHSFIHNKLPWRRFFWQSLSTKHWTKSLTHQTGPQYNVVYQVYRYNTTDCELVLVFLRDPNKMSSLDSVVKRILHVWVFCQIGTAYSKQQQLMTTPHPKSSSSTAVQQESVRGRIAQNI